MADAFGRAPGHITRVEDRRTIVTQWSGFKDWHNAPPDYDTFVRQYAGYTRVLCIRFGVIPNNLEDVVQALLLRFIERDSIGVFDPAFETCATRKARAVLAQAQRAAALSRRMLGVSDSTLIAADVAVAEAQAVVDTACSKFRSYYSRFIHLYVKGLKRNSVRVAQHELQIWDARVGEDEDTMTGGDLLGIAARAEDFVLETECRDFEQRLRSGVTSETTKAVVDAIVFLSRTLARPPRASELAATAGCSEEEVRRELLAVRRLAQDLRGADDLAPVG